MQIKARFTFGDPEISKIVRSYPVLSEIPHFLRHHRGRLRSVDELVFYVRNPKIRNVTSVSIATFHGYRTPYAAIDAMAPALAEYFLQTDIVPVVDPFDRSLRSIFSDYRPDLWSAWRHHGILVPKEVWR